MLAQEQQRSQHRALRYARINLGPGRMLTTDDNSLDTVLEKTADPGMSSILDTMTFWMSNAKYCMHTRLLLHILSVVNLHWLLYVCSVHWVYEQHMKKKYLIQTMHW